MRVFGADYLLPEGSVSAAATPPRVPPNRKWNKVKNKFSDHAKFFYRVFTGYLNHPCLL